MKYSTQLRQNNWLVIHLGKINDRQLSYINGRANQHWFEELPDSNWLAFVIADIDDREFVTEVPSRCLDKDVCYICCSGQLSSQTEDFFDEEIVWRELQKEDKSGKSPDYVDTPLTTSHKNFGEGFWFATVVAQVNSPDTYRSIARVACIDFNQEGVQQQLIKLIDQINTGWVPSDDLNEPNYDNGY